VDRICEKDGKGTEKMVMGRQVHFLAYFMVEKNPESSRKD
jgi:hypothetical protein